MRRLRLRPHRRRRLRQPLPFGLIALVQEVLFRPSAASEIKTYSQADLLYVLGRKLGYKAEDIRALPVDLRSRLMTQSIEEMESDNKFRRTLLETIIKAAGGTPR